MPRATSGAAALGGSTSSISPPPRRGLPRARDRRQLRLGRRDAPRPLYLRHHVALPPAHWIAATVRTELAGASYRAGEPGRSVADKRRALPSSSRTSSASRSLGEASVRAVLLGVLTATDVRRSLRLRRSAISDRPRTSDASMRLSTAMLLIAFLVSSVADPMCGTMIAFGSSRISSSTEGGSSSSTSSPAPAIWPSASAFVSAFWRRRFRAPC